MTTISPAAPARVIIPRVARTTVRSGRPRVGVRRSTPLVWPGGHHDQFLIVEAVTERPLGELRSARVTEKPTWVLNGVGTMGITCSNFDDGWDHLVDPATLVDGAGQLRLLGREIQWWRDGVLMWDGPAIKAKPSLTGVTPITCMDKGWYLTRRVFGAAERRDLLGDRGQMEIPGLPGWVEHGATKARDTTIKARGASSMRLTGVGTVRTTFPHSKTTVAGVLPVHLTGVVRLPAGTPVGTPIASITVRAKGAPTVLDTTTIYSTEDTKLGAWWRFAGYALLPPSVPHDVDVDLWSIGTHGPTRFDDVRSLKNDTTGIPAPGADLTTHARAAMNHWQGHDHSTFGFRVKVITTTGTVEPLGIRHAAHQQATDFLAGYTDRVDGFDWWIDGRDFCVAHRRGVDHTALVLDERSISSGEWDHDESERSTDVIVLGEGDGTFRPEGSYVHRNLPGGLALDWVHQPGDGTPLSALDPIARQIHQEKSQPLDTPSPVTCSADLFPRMNPGDRLKISARSGKLRLPPTPMRIGQIAFDVDAHQLELT